MKTIQIPSEVNSKEELREAKKIRTKLYNRFENAVHKFDKKIGVEETAKELYYRDFKYDDKSDLKDALWSMLCISPFHQHWDDRFISKIDVIKGKYRKLAKLARQLNDEVEPIRVECRKIEAIIEAGDLYVNGSTEAERALLNMSKDKENAEKYDALIDYSRTLKDWKPATVENGQLTINGKNVGSEAYVGIRIGQGIRIHTMKVYATKIEDEKDEDFGKEVIGVRNYTQWRWSDLVIFDIIENIPENVRADR